MVKNKLLGFPMISVIITIVLLTSVFGCAGNQTLRGTDNNRSNVIEPVDAVELEKMPWDRSDTQPTNYTFLYGLWAITILVCCFFLWKDKKLK